MPELILIPQTAPNAPALSGTLVEALCRLMREKTP